MKIDTQELVALAQTREQPRIDMYGAIHKAVRALMCDTLLRVGALDSSDADERAATAARVGLLLDFCSAHLDHENLYVHAAIEARAPGASQHVAQEHVDHAAHIARLRAECASLRDATTPAPSAQAAATLYQSLCLFVADNFQHMHIEETVHNTVLWAHYSDAELVAIHTALVESIGPQEMALTLRWMLPAMAPQERTAMLADMQAHAPAAAFAATLDIARQHLDTQGWSKLARSLGLPQVDGLVQG